MEMLLFWIKTNVAFQRKVESKKWKVKSEKAERLNKYLL